MRLHANCGEVDLEVDPSGSRATCGVPRRWLAAARALVGCLWALGWLVVGFTAVRAAAQPQASEARAQLLVVAPPGCVSPASIEARVRARSARIELVQAASAATRLRVELQGDEARGWHAQLQVTWPDGRRSERLLSIRHCREASDALAFLIVLTLEQGADATEATAHDSGAPGPGPSAGEAGATGEPGGRTSLAASPDSAPEAGRPAPEGAAPARSERLATPAEAADDAADSGSSELFAFDSIGLSVLAQSTLGAAPSALWGLGVQLSVIARGSGLWLPALQLRASRQWAADWHTAWGVASFRLDTLRLDVCPVGLRWSVLTARACLAGGLGSLQARGSATYAPRSRSRSWIDTGATLAVSADLGRLWQLGVNVGLVLPWQRDRFAFRPEVFHRVSPLCWTFDVRIGLRFP